MTVRWASGLGGSPDPSRHVVVVGLMGTGKTTIGSALAEALRRPFSDSDVEIEKTTGRTARDIAETGGPDAIHFEEEQHLFRSLASPTPLVIGAAASVIDVDACRAALAASGVAVWLRADRETLVSRFASSAHRPLYGSSVADMFDGQIRTRYPLYEASAQVIVDVDPSTDHGTPVAIADQVCLLLGWRKPLSRGEDQRAE